MSCKVQTVWPGGLGCYVLVGQNYSQNKSGRERELNAHHFHGFSSCFFFAKKPKSSIPPYTLLLSGFDVEY